MIPALGGTERQVIGLDTIGIPSQLSLAWTRDSKYLVVSERLAGEQRNGLHLVDVATGESRPLTHPPSASEDMAPAVSPDGRVIAYTRDTGRGVSSIMLLPFPNGREPRPLFERNRSRNIYDASPVWMPNSKSVVFASDSGGNRRLWLAPVYGFGQAVELAALGGNVRQAAASGDGQLAFVHETLDENIWRLDLGTVGSGSSPEKTRVAPSTRVQQAPSLAPGSSQIAFESERSGNSEIWAAHADGSDPIQLTEIRNPGTGSPDWSPDGLRVAFDSRVGGRPQIYLIPAAGGKPVKVPTGDGNSVVPRFSPDGRWIYYSSDRSGQVEIWRTPVSGGAGERVTKGGGFAAIPSASGTFLYYLSSNAPVSDLWKWNLSSGVRTPISSSVFNRAFVPSSNGVFFFSAASGERNSLVFFDESSEKRSILFHAGVDIGPGMALSADGRFLYYVQTDQKGNELLLIQKFWK